VAAYTAEENSKLRLFMELAAGPVWLVFDLCPLRTALTAGKMQGASQSLQRTIMGYDYLIIIPETTASHAM
jgi:hypothetical protein